MPCVLLFRTYADVDYDCTHCRNLDGNVLKLYPVNYRLTKPLLSHSTVTTKLRIIDRVKRPMPTLYYNCLLYTSRCV